MDFGVSKGRCLRAVFLLLAAGWSGGCDPFETGFEPEEAAVLYEAAEKTDAPEPSGSLVIMDWNVKFGGGRIDFWFDCHGDRVLMERSEVIDNLEGLAAKIREVDPDILFLQEVDVDSKRSAFVDQMQWLLDHTELNYGAYASQWKALYVPSDGIGRVNSGSAILSRWELTEARRVALALRTDQSALTQYFYLRRNFLSALVEIPGYGPLSLLNIHAEAYSQDDTKKKHLERFKQELDDLNAAGVKFVAGGDLNAVPPGTETLTGFPDSICESEDFPPEDYAVEDGWIDPFYEDYASAIPLADYQADNASYFSHSLSEDHFWSRTLDYLFTNGTFVTGTGQVHQDESDGGLPTMPLSDHAPVSVSLDLDATYGARR